MSESEGSLARAASSGKAMRRQKPAFSRGRKRAVLAVFARAPQVGKVKTRLARTLGDDAALRIYIAMLRDTLALSQRAARLSRAEVVLFFTPPESRTAKFASCEYSRVVASDCEAKYTRRALRKNVSQRQTIEREYSLNELWSGMALPQSGGDLGEKMRDCDGFLRASGAHRVVIVGCDAPDLPPKIIGAAFEALQSCDLVFGPAQDGGFYLIGTSRKIPRALFAGVLWSRADVLSRVLANAKREKLRVAMLPAWRDVDDLSDLRALKRRLQKQ